MASWSELLKDFHSNVSKNPNWLDDNLKDKLSEISQLCSDRTVIFYASAFLQKKDANNLNVSITREDVNGLMNAIYGTDIGNGLVLILHTPGGDLYAVESIVDYLHSKFDHIEVIVPYLAMSDGAMISLASNRVILGKQSQLGPIDPQFSIGNKAYSFYKS